MNDRRTKRATVAVLPLVVLPCVAVLLGRECEPWQFMWSLAVAIYAGCKWLTWWTCDQRATFARHALYLLAWPGLDAQSFLGNRPGVPVRLTEYLAAIAKLLLGLALLLVAARNVMDRPYAYGWLGMVALVLVLHFGLFHILSCVYRGLGIDAPPLMNRPAVAKTVAEFWGKRWNVAFRDITHRFLFKPLIKRLGTPAALIIGFIVSGLVHELVITVPARGGYGLPTLYFAAQGGAMLVERTRIGSKIRGHVFTLMVTAGLAPLLFPPIFVERVIAPFLTSLQSLFRGDF